MWSPKIHLLLTLSQKLLEVIHQKEFKQKQHPENREISAGKRERGEKRKEKRNNKKKPRFDGKKRITSTPDLLRTTICNWLVI